MHIDKTFTQRLDRALCLDETRDLPPQHGRKAIVMSSSFCGEFTTNLFQDGRYVSTTGVCNGRADAHGRAQAWVDNALVVA
jgi:hypothetical protein